MKKAIGSLVIGCVVLFQIDGEFESLPFLPTEAAEQVKFRQKTYT